MAGTSPLVDPRGDRNYTTGKAGLPAVRKRQGISDPATAVFPTLAPGKEARKYGRKTPKVLHSPSTSALPRKLTATITQP